MVGMRKGIVIWWGCGIVMEVLESGMEMVMFSLHCVDPSSFPFRTGRRYLLEPVAGRTLLPVNFFNYQFSVNGYSVAKVDG